MVLLTAGDVCRIAGIHSNSLDRWVTAGLLDPANFGRGTGTHRLYSLAQCFAVAAGIRYRDEGADPGRVAGVVKFLAGQTLERLEAEFATGRTYPVPATLLERAAAEEDVALPDAWIPGFLMEPPNLDKLSPGTAKLLRRIDLVPILAEVKRKVEELSRRPDKRKKHRRRAGVSKGAMT
jgi:hypothetical protein